MYAKLTFRNIEFFHFEEFQKKHTFCIQKSLVCFPIIMNFAGKSKAVMNNSQTNIAKQTIQLREIVK